MNWRRLATVALGALALTFLAPASADAAGLFNYWRNGSLINGRIQYDCSNSPSCFSPLYRAGSGSGFNECQTNNWIPAGRFTVPWHQDHFAGSLIQGRVWRLSDYQCTNGVRRTELFVHSEETSGQGQYCPTGGDDPFCWESVNDYYSNGCIKIARMPVTGGASDLGRMDGKHHALQAVAWVDVIG